MSLSLAVGRFWKGLCSVHLAIPGGAETAAEETEHEEDSSNPEGHGHLEVVDHSPWECIASSFLHGATADGVVLGEHEDSGGDQDSELEEAGEEGAVDGAHSHSPSPGSDEHEEGVEANDTVGSAHEDASDGETGTSLLAVIVTVLPEIDLSLEEAKGDILVVDVEASVNFKVSLEASSILNFSCVGV